MSITLLVTDYELGAVNLLVINHELTALHDLQNVAPTDLHFQNKLTDCQTVLVDPRTVPGDLRD